MASQSDYSQQAWQKSLRSEFYSRNTSKTTQDTPNSAGSKRSKSTKGSTSVEIPQTVLKPITSGQLTRLSTNRATNRVLQNNLLRIQINSESPLNQKLLEVKGERKEQRYSSPRLSKTRNAVYKLTQQTQYFGKLQSEYQASPANHSNNRMPKHKFLLDTPSSISIQSSSVDGYTSNLHSSQSSSANQTALEATQQVAIKLGALVSPSVNIFNTNQTTANPAATAGFGGGQANPNTVTLGAAGGHNFVQNTAQGQQTTAKGKDTRRNREQRNQEKAQGKNETLVDELIKQAQALAKQIAAKTPLYLDISPVIAKSGVKRDKFTHRINFSNLPIKNATAEQKPVINLARLTELSKPRLKVEKKTPPPASVTEIKPYRDCQFGTNQNNTPVTSYSK